MKNILNPCPTCGTFGTCENIEAGMMSGIAHNTNNPTMKPIIHPDCNNPDCYKENRGGSCGKCCDYEQEMKPTDKSTMQKVCECRGNLNANNLELPCSSCGGINPNKSTKPPVEVEKKLFKLYQGMVDKMTNPTTSKQELDAKISRLFKLHCGYITDLKYNQPILNELYRDITVVMEEAHESGKQEERALMKTKAGSLRQWLNERPATFLITNEVIQYWLFDEPLKDKT